MWYQIKSASNDFNFTRVAFTAKASWFDGGLVKIAGSGGQAVFKVDEDAVKNEAQEGKKEDKKEDAVKNGAPEGKKEDKKEDKKEGKKEGNKSLHDKANKFRAHISGVLLDAGETKGSNNDSQSGLDYLKALLGFTESSRGGGGESKNRNAARSAYVSEQTKR